MTANSEITSILQKTALEILTQIDPQTSPHTRTTANSHVQDSRANHHSSKDSHEALLQHTIQLYRDALGTLRKDLSLDDADTLAYHQNKLKQAQIDLLNSQTKKKQDKLLANVACIMEMPETLHDKILVLCGIIFENTKTTTLRILYHLKLALTHLLMPAFGKAGLLPSTPLTGTASDSP